MRLFRSYQRHWDPNPPSFSYLPKVTSSDILGDGALNGGLPDLKTIFPNAGKHETYYDIAFHRFDIILSLYEHLNQNQLGYELPCPSRSWKSSSDAILLGTPVRCIHHLSKWLGLSDSNSAYFHKGLLPPTLFVLASSLVIFALARLDVHWK